jgi:ectoine hydroxylase-related dioxygenase (phytanoyl-CoA dioxygenase family)
MVSCSNLSGLSTRTSRDFVCEKVLFLNAMFIIDDFTVETGGTNIVPFTHKIAKFPSERYLEANAIPVETKAGSVFFFDGLLLHKSGSNTSGKIRRAVNHGYTRPFLKQQMDYAHMLNGKVDPNSKFAQVVGLWSVPPKSVDEYRVDPDKRTYRKGQG